MPDVRLIPLLIFAAMAGHFMYLAIAPTAIARTRWAWGRDGSIPASRAAFLVWASALAAVAVMVGFAWTRPPMAVVVWVLASIAAIPMVGLCDSWHQSRRKPG